MIMRLYTQARHATTNETTKDNDEGTTKWKVMMIK